MQLHGNEAMFPHAQTRGPSGPDRFYQLLEQLRMEYETRDQGGMRQQQMADYERKCMYLFFRPFSNFCVSGW